MEEAALLNERHPEMDGTFGCGFSSSLGEGGRSWGQLSSNRENGPHPSSFCRVN